MKKKKGKILIIEDDAFLAKAYQIKFSKESLPVSIAADGDEGLKSAKKEPPDLILLDLMLPKMNGFEFLKLIKQDEQLKTIPVVVLSVLIKQDERLKSVPVVTLSNLGQKTDQEKALALGAAEYFIKTEHTLEDIIKRIKKYL
jgi:CheY-like chemotaxis protein